MGQRTSSAEFTSLVSGPTSIRHNPMTSIDRRAALASLPGGSWKEVALAAMEASNGCRRDVSLKATPELKAAVANMDSKSKAQLERLSAIVHATTKKATTKKTASGGRREFRGSVANKGRGSAENEYDLPGVLPPLGYFDPAGFATDVDKDRLLYFREAEIKHGRVCMAATLGFVVGERYHPLFGGANDAPSLFAVTDASLTSFWPAILVVIGFTEAYSAGWFTGNKRNAGGDRLAEGFEPGDLGYDPLGLLPEDPEELKEILNGRFAMISLLGMVAEEFVTKEKLHGLNFG